MAVELDPVVLAMPAGALGGIMSYVVQLFGGFQSIPTSVPDTRWAMSKQRIYFSIGRTLFGGICGFVAGYWYLHKGLSTEAYLVTAFSIGFTTSSLTSLLKKVAA